MWIGTIVSSSAKWGFTLVSESGTLGIGRAGISCGKNSVGSAGAAWKYQIRLGEAEIVVAHAVYIRHSGCKLRWEVPGTVCDAQLSVPGSRSTSEAESKNVLLTLNSIELKVVSTFYTRPHLPWYSGVNITHLSPTKTIIGGDLAMYMVVQPTPEDQDD